MPLLAMIATLPMHIFAGLCNALETTDPAIMNIGSARDNIFLKFRPFTAVIARYGDVWEQLPEMHTLRFEANHLVPKTIVYVNDKKMVLSLCRPLHEQMSTKQLKLAIKYHHGFASETHRTESEKALADGSCRTVVAMDATGMGPDIPDIDRVIQVPPDDSVSPLVQRLGRTGRDGQRQAVGVLL
jgi:ATP-dependent DNA helicase RecQ